MKNLLLTGIFLMSFLACNNTKPASEQNEKNVNENNETMTLTQNQTSMKGFKTNIEKEALSNENYRKVLYSAKHLQVVLMSLKVGEEIGEETHPLIDQFFRFESGNGKCIINGNTYNVSAGDAIVVPAGAKHNIINVDTKEELKMYTIYAPPNHKDGLVRATKKDADNNGVKFDGKTTE